MKTCHEILNEGIPSIESITITEDELKYISSLKEKELYKRILEKLGYISNPYDPEHTTRMGAFQIPEINTVINTNGEKFFRFSASSFYNNISEELNVKTNKSLIDDEDTRKEAQTQLDKLLKIETETALKNSFPLLYKIYKLQKKRYTEMEKEIQRIKTSGLSNDKKRRCLIYLYHYMKQSFPLYDLDKMHTDARDFSVKEFCEYSYDRYKKIIDNMDEVIKFIKNYVIDLEDLELNKEKLNLLISSKYLNNCDLSNMTKEKKQHCINYLSTYFRKDSNRKNDNTTTAKVLRYKEPYEYEYVTPKIIYERYQRFLKDNPNIRIINLDNEDLSKMNIFEIQEYILEILKTETANWDIIPENKVKSTINGNLKGNYNGYVNYNGHKVSEQRVLDLHIEKQEFFASTDPFCVIKGKKTFRGYIGYVYSNGIVVLERYYKNLKTGKLAYGEAVYIMDINDFHTLSKYPKRVLINDPRVAKQDHDKGWQDIVRPFIDAKNLQAKPQDEIKRLKQLRKIK